MKKGLLAELGDRNTQHGLAEFATAGPTVACRRRCCGPVGLCLTLLLFSPGGAGAADDPQAPILRVDGVAIVSMRPAVRVGEQWFVPLSPLVTALGATLSLMPGAQSFHVMRRDGVVVDYDGHTGRFRQGSMLLGDLQNFRQVQLTGPAENLLFPLSGAVILLGISAREDLINNVLEIESQPSNGGSSKDAPRFQPSKLDYMYNLGGSGHIFGQYVNLRGEALMGGNRLLGALMIGEGSSGGMPQFRSASIRLELPHGRAVTVGDQATWAAVEAMGTAVRGVGYEQPIGGFLAQFEAGRAVSSVNAAAGSAGIARFDTDFMGLGMRRSFKTADASRRATLSLQADAFRGSARKGVTFGLAYEDQLWRNQFRLQTLAGSFSGDSEREIPLPVVPAVTEPVLLVDPAFAGGSVTVPPVLESRPIHVEGPGYGFSITDNFNPFHNKWVLMGLWELYSRNFLTVRDTSRFNAVRRRAASTTLQPITHLSFNGGINDSAYSLGTAEVSRGYNYGANASLPLEVPVQLGYFRTIQSMSGQSNGRFDMAQYSLQLPRLGRYSIGGAFSDFTFNGTAGHLVNGTLSGNFSRRGNVTLHYQSQLGNGTNAGVDWSGEVGRKRNGYIRLGVERQMARGVDTFYAPVVSFGLPLPRGQVLTLSYMGMRGSSMLQLTLGGSLLGHREMLQVDGVSAMLVQAPLTGQVYWDKNGNGKFDSGVDRPIPQLQITLDGQQSTVTDAFGYFRFDHVDPGTHRLRAGMESVPASLVFADGEEHMSAVIPYRENRQDFRAVEAGQIRGRVMIEEEGFFVKAPPLKPAPDVHILSSRDRDSFTEGDGVFVLGDLVPGTYVLHLDPASIPRGLVPSPASRSVVVKPGQTATDVEFRLARPVIEKQAPPIKSDATPGHAPSTGPATHPAPLFEAEVVRMGTRHPELTGNPVEPQAEFEVGIHRPGQALREEFEGQPDHSVATVPATAADSRPAPVQRRATTLP